MLTDVLSRRRNGAGGLPLCRLRTAIKAAEDSPAAEDKDTQKSMT